MKKMIFAALIAATLYACGKSDDDAVVLTCGGYDVRVEFSNNGDTLCADINGDTVDMARAVSASGAKYEGAVNDTPVVLWEKGREWTMILDDDMVVPCDAK